MPQNRLEAGSPGGVQIMQRAYALARSGSCLKVEDIRRKLKSEGYTHVDDFIAGRSLLDQLKRLCAEATSADQSGIKDPL